MDEKLRPRTSIDRGPPGEEPIVLEERRPEVLPEAGGDTAGLDSDTNIGGAPATAGLDSGGAVGVRRGRAVGRPGAEYETAPDGETSSDVVEPSSIHYEEEEEEEWEIANPPGP